MNLSFLRDRRLRRILALMGHELRLGRPKAGDGVLVWGASPTAGRGERAALASGAALIRVEDAFLRSIRPGRMGDAPIGLLVDARGVHFDASRPSLIEHILSTDPLDNSQLLQRAKDGVARLRTLDISKYNLHDPDLSLPDPGYVLVVDQTRNDASVTASVAASVGGGFATAESAPGADQTLFDDMLDEARNAHPNARIIIKTHPETQAGLRPGYYAARHCDERTTLLSDPVSPWKLVDGAIAVYTVSSQLGFEALLAGHRPQVWGQPFYAGWGLTDDRIPLLNRTRRLTRNQLFAGAMLLAPVWYDPARDRLCTFEEALDQLEAETRAYRQDRRGHVAAGMRLWKRGRLQAFFGRERALIFVDDPARAATAAREKHRDLLVWAGRLPEGFAAPAIRVEDGFLRSRGLGAELVPPLSLVTDSTGIYYDPAQPSDLEALIQSPLPPGGRARAERFLEKLRAARLTKYNLGGAVPKLPVGGLRILVPGQVEDDASILTGAGEIRSNLALLAAVRAENPAAHILYKPHPDVEAGLRAGAIPEAEALALADMVLPHTDMAALLEQVDEVWTMTSLTGFEALLRGLSVTTYGAPFYAGWGLTRDLGPVPERRIRGADGGILPRPDLVHLAHAALIAYPRYWDPVSRRPCPPEVALERLATGAIPHPGLLNRLLSKLQGRLAGYARFWR